MKAAIKKRMIGKKLKQIIIFLVDERFIEGYHHASVREIYDNIRKTNNYNTKL